MKRWALISVLVLALITPSVGITQVPIGPTSTSETTAAIGTSTTVVLPNAFTTRKGLLLINISDEEIFCSFGQTAALNQGQSFQPAGGGVLYDRVVPVTALNCIHGGTGTKNLLVTEFE